MTPAALEKALASAPDTKAIIPVHFAGLAHASAEIRALAKGRVVIEDAAHAVGGNYACGKPVGCGAYSDMSVFSFHPVKTITTGEGGAVVTNDDELAHRLRAFRSHGIERDPARFSGPETREDGRVKPWLYEQQTARLQLSHDRYPGCARPFAARQARSLSGTAARHRAPLRRGLRQAAACAAAAVRAAGSRALRPPSLRCAVRLCGHADNADSVHDEVARAGDRDARSTTSRSIVIRITRNATALLRRHFRRPKATTAAACRCRFIRRSPMTTLSASLQP